MKITQAQTIPIGGMRLVRITTDEGITGLGEIPPFNPCVNISFAIQKLGLVGRNPLRIEQFWHETYHSTFFRGGPFFTTILSGVEQALWDIKGKHLGVPVNHLLGGPMRDRIKLYTHFGGNTPEECAESALGAVEFGFQAIKTDPFRPRNLTMSAAEMRKAVERIRATREVVGDDVDILIECHGFLNANTAIVVGRMLEEFNPFFYEEPVPPENVDEMAKVAASVNIPIAAGERLYTRWGFREYLEKQVVDYIQPDLCHCGGFSEGRLLLWQKPIMCTSSPITPTGLFPQWSAYTLAHVRPILRCSNIGGRPVRQMTYL